MAFLTFRSAAITFCLLPVSVLVPRLTYGESDQYGIEVAKEMVHFHDFHATILHLLGMDHTRLTYRYSGRDFRLTDVAGQVVKGVLA